MLPYFVVRDHLDGSVWMVVGGTKVHARLPEGPALERCAELNADHMLKQQMAVAA